MPLLRNPPKTSSTLVISYPTPQILLVTIDSGHNQLNMETQHTLSKIWTWYDREPSLRCAIITGSRNSFCAGADLKEWLATRDALAESLNANGGAGSGDVPPKWGEVEGGFGGMSRRVGKKPIVAAINGFCLGGGMEMAVNCDLVIASERAVFGLPEVKIGVFAKAGALPRVVRFLGLQRASQLALLGETISPQQAHAWGLVNAVVKHEEVLDVAIKWAKKVCGNSPDSVVVSRYGMMMGLEHGSLERGTQLVNDSPQVLGLEEGENIHEGLMAFKEKRAPRWTDSKL